MSTTHENYGDLHGNRAYGEDYNTPTEGTDDRMLFLDGCVLSDPATWDGTGSGAKALYGQYMQQRNALGDAHVLPVQCGGSDTCVGLECLWARSIARSPSHNPHDP